MAMIPLPCNILVLARCVCGVAGGNVHGGSSTLAAAVSRATRDAIGGVLTELEFALEFAVGVVGGALGWGGGGRG